MKVRAIRDGHYGGYYRVGPIIGDNGSWPGEVFEVSDKLVPILDMETGKPLFEKDKNGEVIIDKDTKKPRLLTKSVFSPTWMERVSEDTLITFDYPPIEIPSQYRIPKPTGAQPPSKSQAPTLANAI